MQGFNARHFSLCTIEMSNQEIVYLTPAFLQNPSEPRNTVRPGGTQRPGKIDGKGIHVLSIWIHAFLWLVKCLKLEKMFLCVFQVLRW